MRRGESKHVPEKEGGRAGIASVHSSFLLNEKYPHNSYVLRDRRVRSVSTQGTNAKGVTCITLSESSGQSTRVSLLKQTNIARCPQEPGRARTYKGRMMDTAARPLAPFAAKLCML